jgi:hypothetical protein
MLLVYRYRIKSLTGLLSRQARACNFVWKFLQRDSTARAEMEQALAERL